MGFDLVSYALFYPETPHPPLPFHITRHIFLLLIMYLALIFDQSFFTVFFLILSALEYVRKGHLRARIFLFFTLLFGLTFFFPLDKSFSFFNSILIYLLRTVTLYLPFFLDSVLYDKIKFTKRTTDFVFPVLFTFSSFIMSKLDPTGIGAHAATFCTDYPDFSFLPLRFAGPSFLVFIISYIASACSRWRSTRFLPRYVIKFVFKVIPLLIVFVFFGRFYWDKERKDFTISAFTSPIQCDEIPQFLDSKIKPSELIIFGGNISKCSDQTLQMIKDRSHNSLILMNINDVTAFNNGDIITRNNLNPFVVNRTFRYLVLTGSQIIDGNAYLAANADIIVTFGCKDEFEKNGYPERTATILAQTIGAHRLHISHTETKGYDKTKTSFLINAAGDIIFKENSDFFHHTTKLAPNVFVYIKEREFILDSIIIISSIIAIIIVFRPQIVNQIVNKKNKFNKAN